MGKRCILCDEPTLGSIGAAGIRWPMVCQPCKDREDQTLARQLDHTAQTINFVSTAAAETRQGLAKIKGRKL